MEQLEDWLKTINVKGSVLDVGGSQLPIKGRTKSWEVSDYKVLDLHKPHECKQEPDIRIDLNYGLIMASYAEKEIIRSGFDVVFCLEVSEYWFDPMTALRALYTLTKDSGLLYISFHFVYPIHNPVENDYLRYTPNGALKLLQEAGFEIVETIPRLAGGDFKSWCISEKMKPADCDMHKWIGVLIKAKKI